jgi:hypothetical protein
MRKNPDSDILIKFSFRALQTYFEFANEFTYVADAKVLFAAFAQHIDLYRVLDQREMYIISTEGDFGGGDFNTEIERVTGAAFAATSIEDVVGWGKGWRKSGRLMGDLYVLEVDGFGRVFSHLNNPERMGIDMSGLRNALAEYQKGYISIEEGIEMSGLLDREYSVPRSEICTTGLGCSIALKEWDTFKVYRVVGDRVEEIDGIPHDVDFPVLRTVYAIADTDAETLGDLMYEGVWGRGVYVTNNLDIATQDAERLGLGVFEVGLTIPEERGTVFDISKKNTVLSTRGSSLKRGMGGSLNAFVVDVLPADESGYAKRFFVSQTPLDHPILYDDLEREALVDQTLEDAGIECGAQGYTSIGSWLRALKNGEIADCEGYEDLVFDMGEEEADEQLIDSYNYLLQESVGLPSYDPYKVLRLHSTSKLGHVIKRRGYSAVRSRLNSPFDNYLCILDPRDMRSWVTADLEKTRPNPSLEWFETQSLQNDEDGFLINPDTGGTLWYHGSRIGDCDAADEIESGHVYLSSDRNLALLFMNEFPLETGIPLTLCTFKVRIPASQIYDVRSMEGKTIADLDSINFDYNQASIYASGNYAGYMEVENTKRITAGDDEPLNLAIHYPFAHALITYGETEYCGECGSSQEMTYEDEYDLDTRGYVEYRECPQCGLQIEDSERGFGYFVVRGKSGVGAGH